MGILKLNDVYYHSHVLQVGVFPSPVQQSWIRLGGGVTLGRFETERRFGFVVSLFLSPECTYVCLKHFSSKGHQTEVVHQ